MYPRNLIILFILILTLSVLFLPALMGTSIFDLPDEDDLADDDDFSIISNFSVAWTGMPAYQTTFVSLWLGLSIFALFLVYLGGRSKHKRFNDRTIDHVNVLIAEHLKTALIRAVFNFPFFINYPNNTLPIFLPILIPNLGRCNLKRLIVGLSLESKISKEVLI